MPKEHKRVPTPPHAMRQKMTRTPNTAAVPWGLTADLSSSILLYRSRPTVGLKREKELMARIVKEHAVRRNEILDVAQRLGKTKSYEQITIQEIMDGLPVSKGAIYYHFYPKQPLLEAAINIIVEKAEQPHLS